MAIRISGIVSMARAVQDRLHHGIPVDERDAFRGEVAERLQQIDMLCADLGGTPAELPAPSRRAYAVLQRALLTDPEALPDCGDALPTPKRMRISGIVKTLSRVQALLAGRAERGMGMSIPSASGLAQISADAIRQECEEAGSTPATLPPPSGKAFGMLSWLGDEPAAERYAAQHALARAAVEPLMLGGNAPHRTLHLAFSPGRHLHSVRRRGPLVQVKLSVGYLTAKPADFDDLAPILARIPGLTSATRERYDQLIDAPGFAEMTRTIDDLWRRTSGSAAGRTYDLEALFHRLNTTYFKGGMVMPRLEWQTSLSFQRFGYYVVARDFVVLDARLDSPAVPEFVAECVLFHELLHKFYGTPRHRGRRRVHPPHFKRHEQIHPRFFESERWLEALASGESGVP